MGQYWPEILYLNSPADATRDLVCGGRGIIVQKVETLNQHIRIFQTK